MDRIRETGYIPGPADGYVIGENLAWGTLSLSTPRAIVAAWVASPEHLANILEGQYVDTGIGVTPAVPAIDSGGQRRSDLRARSSGPSSRDALRPRPGFATLRRPEKGGGPNVE